MMNNHCPLMKNIPYFIFGEGDGFWGGRPLRFVSPPPFPAILPPHLSPKSRVLPTLKLFGQLCRKVTRRSLASPRWANGFHHHSRLSWSCKTNLATIAEYRWISENCQCEPPETSSLMLICPSLSMENSNPHLSLAMNHTMIHRASRKRKPWRNLAPKAQIWFQITLMQSTSRWLNHPPFYAQAKIWSIPQLFCVKIFNKDLSY